MTTEQFKSALAKILPEYPVMLAYLFGSVAEKCVREKSDIDLALVLKSGVPEKKSLDIELAVASKLDEMLNVSGKCDVRSIQTAPIYVQGEVITRGINIYSKDEKFRVDFETRVRSRYFDMLPYYTIGREELFNSIRRNGLYGQP